MTATPVLSYPRYSRRLSPLMTKGKAGCSPRYPTIPHMVLKVDWGVRSVHSDRVTMNAASVEDRGVRNTTCSKATEESSE